MPVLAEILRRSGATDVTTVLNSCNAVFTAPTILSAPALESAIAVETGVSTRVVLVEGSVFRQIVEAAPFDGDLSRLTIAFMNVVPADILLPEPDSLVPEQIAIGEHAVYQSLPDGVSKSKIPAAWWKQFPAETTVRNLRTAQKLASLL